jgi:hypothetical protein
MHDTMSWRERRKRAREGMANGSLPLTIPARTFGSTANGDPCVVCHRPILPTELLFGLTLPTGEVVVHSGCLQAWQQECSDGVSAAPATQAASPRRDIAGG